MWELYRSDMASLSQKIIQSVFLTRTCEETTRTTSFLLVQKEWTYSMFSSLLGFRWMSSIPDKITTASCARSSEVFKSLKEGDHLRWVWSESTIKWSNDQYFPAQKELTFLPAVKTSQRVVPTFFEWKLTLKIIDSKWHFREENMLLRGDLVFLPTFVHHLNTGTLPEEHLPTSLWGYVSGRVDPNQLRCRKKQHQTNIYALQHCSISTLLWSFFLSKWQCFRNRWRSPSFSPKQTKMLHVLLACIIPHQWLARDMCCDHRGIAEARDVDRGCYMFTQQGQQIQHHHDLRGSNPLFNQGPYMPTRLLRQVKNFPNNTWKKASGQLDSTLPLLGQKANTWNPMLSQPP